MDTKEILEKYSAKLESEVSKTPGQSNISEEYIQFKKDLSYNPTRYERWAKFLGNIINLKVSEKDRIKIEKELAQAHVNVNASQALLLSLVSFTICFIFVIAIATAYYLINPAIDPMNLAIFSILGLIASVFIFYYTYTLPKRLANEWRLKASSEMVPAILYIVIYMKHTPNLERAIAFAADRLEGPLALDFKKIFYDVEIGKFSTIKQSIDSYLKQWENYTPEFIESFHLIESSLYEPSESRRVEILEKSLQVILDGIYEKMLKYSRDIRSPLTNIYMLGIILPTLGLAMLPLASTLLQGMIQWQHFMVGINIIVPFIVFYIISEVLLKRPGGYGESSILELNPDYKKFKSKKPWIISGLISLPIMIIGFIPLISRTNLFASIFGKSDFTLAEFGIGLGSKIGEMKIFDFDSSTGASIGPFSPISALFSLLIPLSIALFFGISYNIKSKELIKARQQTKSLEEEFTNSLFLLGNRLGDGVPAEIVFAKVAESTQGQTTQRFFSIVNQNIQQLGFSLESAIFDKKRGAIIYYPSSLISTSMRILIESVKKGLRVAAQSLMSISEYIKNIQKINQRLRDLLAEIVSDMKSNMVFLAPLLSGIVVGLGTMITLILKNLQALQNQIGGDQTSTFSGFIKIFDIFDVNQMVPPYYLQMIVGIYIVEITFILTSALVTIDSGKDVLQEKYELSKNLKTGIIFYIGTSLISIICLAALAIVAIGGLGL